MHRNTCIRRGASTKAAALRMTLRSVGVAGLLAIALPLVTAAPASAFVRDCNHRIYLQAPHALISLTTVLNVRNVSCARARRVVSAHAPSANRSRSLSRVGGRFRLGGYRCRVYYVNYEDHMARCVYGTTAFRIDYGS